MFDEHRQWAERMCGPRGPHGRRAAVGRIDRRALRRVDRVRSRRDDRDGARGVSRCDAGSDGRSRAEMAADFVRLGVDPCGERGEYHTVVTNTPLFSRAARARYRRASSSTRAAGRSTSSGPLTPVVSALGGRRIMLEPPTSRSPIATARKVARRRLAVASARGSIVGLLGPNGSGKTTLAPAADGTLTPSRGSRVARRRAARRRCSRRDLARRIAVVPQETHATFDFTALEIVLMGRYAHLGAFELEGPDDLAIARQRARRDRHRRRSSRASSPRSAAARSSAS